MSLPPDAGPGEAFAKASRFREDLFDCLTARGVGTEHRVGVFDSGSSVVLSGIWSGWHA